jgi:hypothetical protein
VDRLHCSVITDRKSAMTRAGHRASVANYAVRCTEYRMLPEKDLDLVVEILKGA